MHGLIFHTLERFVVETYGHTVWEAITIEAKSPTSVFEPMLEYEPMLLDRLIDASSVTLGKARIAILEDVGTFLIADTERVRYLLRFSGETFRDFLLALDELPDRIRLAVPSLDLPPIGLVVRDDGTTEIFWDAMFSGGNHLLAGLIRGMADDYGALITIDAPRAGPLRVSIHGAVTCSATEHDMSKAVAS
ncbi:MAG: heme NO-binding domain-containing protein [Pseudomonadota bacterium]